MPKTATAAEIKKSYRELARKWHPDANKGSADAEERFKEITEAYNVLSDEKQRKEYDEARSMFGGFRVPAGSRPGAGGTTFDLGDLFGNGEGLGDVLGGIFRNRPGGGAASRARRGADVETETTLPFGDAIDGATVIAPPDRGGPLPGLRRHRREVRHGSQGLPGLPRHRAAVKEPRRLRALRALQDLPGPGARGGGPVPVVQRQRAGDELAHHPGAHPRRGGGRAADPDSRQGRPGRARRQGGRPVRPRARQAARGVRQERGQPDGDGAGDDHRAGARRGHQGADAPRPRGHRARQAGLGERDSDPRSRPGRPQARTGRSATCARPSR